MKSHPENLTLVLGWSKKKVFLYNSPLDAFHHFIQTFLLVSLIHTYKDGQEVNKELFICLLDQLRRDLVSIHSGLGRDLFLV